MKHIPLLKIFLLVPFIVTMLGCAPEDTSNVVIATLTPDPDAPTPTIDPLLLTPTPYPLADAIAVLDRQQVTLTQEELPDLYPDGNYTQALYMEQLESQNVTHRDIAFITVTIFPDDESAFAYFQGLKSGVPTGENPASVEQNEFDRDDLSYLSRSFQSASPTATDPGVLESYYVVHACNFVYSFEVINFFGEGLGSPLPDENTVPRRVVETGQGLASMICLDEAIDWR